MWKLEAPGSGFSKMTFSKCYLPVNSIQSAVSRSFSSLAGRLSQACLRTFTQKVSLSHCLCNPRIEVNGSDLTSDSIHANFVSLGINIKVTLDNAAWMSAWRLSTHGWHMERVCSRRTLPRTNVVILKSGLWERDHLLEDFVPYFWLNTVPYLWPVWVILCNL